MRDHSPTARHPSTPQSRATARRKRKQLSALTQRLIAGIVPKATIYKSIPTTTPTTLKAILAQHNVRRI